LGKTLRACTAQKKMCACTAQIKGARPDYVEKEVCARTALTEGLRARTALA
jgi:hypothetical protein